MSFMADIFASAYLSEMGNSELRHRNYFIHSFAFQNELQLKFVQLLLLLLRWLLSFKDFAH